MDKDKRELTEKERKRRDCFETLCTEMQQKGHKIKNVTINTQKAKYLALFVMLPFMALAFWLYNNANGFNLDRLSWGYAVALPLLILGLIIVHELIHGMTWAIFAKNHFHAIDFGIAWSTLSPYCACFEPLKRWKYLLGTAMPTLVLGGGGAVAAVMTNQLLLFFAAEYMILSGGGDFQLILRSILTDQRGSVYCAHPDECGFAVFEK